jgi:hypothetical protein
MQSLTELIMTWEEEADPILVKYARRVVSENTHHWVWDPDVNGTAGLVRRDDPQRAIVVIYGGDEGDWEYDTSVEEVMYGRGLDIATYKRCYSAGWASSMRRQGGMDDAEGRFLSRNGYAWSSPEHWAWEDGWLDMAAGRPKWHLLTCLDHDKCP